MALDQYEPDSSGSAKFFAFPCPSELVKDHCLSLETDSGLRCNWVWQTYLPLMSGCTALCLVEDKCVQCDL
ncbi:hypothetical protein Tco_1428123 [Tanacetum coccineum]